MANVGTPKTVLAAWRRLAIALIYGVDGKAVSDGKAYQSVYPRAKIETARVNVCRLRQNPKFLEVYNEEFEHFRAAEVKHPLATRRGQVEAKLRRLRDLYEIAAERAAVYGGLEINPQEVFMALASLLADKLSEEGGETVWRSLTQLAEQPPGGGTGWLVRQETDRTVNYKVDSGLLAEIRELESEILEMSSEALARKLDLTSGGKPLTPGIDLSKLSMEDLTQLHGILAKTAEPAGS